MMVTKTTSVINRASQFGKPFRLSQSTNGIKQITRIKAINTAPRNEPTARVAAITMAKPAATIMARADAEKVVFLSIYFLLPPGYWLRVDQRCGRSETGGHIIEPRLVQPETYLP